MPPNKMFPSVATFALEACVDVAVIPFFSQTSTRSEYALLTTTVSGVDLTK
jgi:hypothetical protein